MSSADGDRDDPLVQKRHAAAWGRPQMTPMQRLGDPEVPAHLGMRSSPHGFASARSRAQASGDHRLSLARPAAHLGELASAERRAYLGAAGVGGLEIGDDGASLRAHVGEAFAALRRPA